MHLAITRPISHRYCLMVRLSSETPQSWSRGELADPDLAWWTASVETSIGTIVFIPASRLEVKMDGSNASVGLDAAFWFWLWFDA
jgi:hypothetical protein